MKTIKVTTSAYLTFDDDIDVEIKNSEYPSIMCTKGKDGEIVDVLKFWVQAELHKTDKNGDEIEPHNIDEDTLVKRYGLMIEHTGGSLKKIHHHFSNPLLRPIIS